MSSMIMAMRTTALACHAEGRRPIAWLVSPPSLEHLAKELEGADVAFYTPSTGGHPARFMDIPVHEEDSWAWGWMLFDEAMARSTGFPVPHRFAEEEGPARCTDCGQISPALTATCPGAPVNEEQSDV